MTKGAMSPLVVEWSRCLLAVAFHDHGDKIIGLPTNPAISRPLHDLDQLVGILAGNPATGASWVDCSIDVIECQCPFIAREFGNVVDGQVTEHGKASTAHVLGRGAA